MAPPGTGAVIHDVGSPPVLKATTGVPQACASDAVGQKLLAGRDNHHIGCAVVSTKCEVVVEVAGVMNWETELRRRLGSQLPNNRSTLQFGVAAQMGES